MAVAFLGTLWKELLWVFSPTKFGNVHVHYGEYRDLLCPIPISAGMLSLRYILTKYCFVPLGQYFGLKNSKNGLLFTPNPLLEEIYTKTKDISRSQILGAAKQLDMTERQIERWLRQRKKQDRPSILTKFSECCWRFTYSTSLFLYGVLVLWNKPWLWDITKCWDGFPDSLKITEDIWWYYMVSLSFYWSLLIGQFCIDVKRKDFWQMFIHHVTTIFLISFSWLARTYRIGTLVLVLHDFGDIFIEASKITKYANYQVACSIIFGVCTVVWISTRMVIYPLWIIKHTLFDSVKYVPNFGAYYTLNGLLIMLLVLHTFWTYLILKIAVNALRAGHVEGDVRSSSDEMSEHN